MHLGDYIICGTQGGRTRPESFKVALHPDFPNQEVAIGGTLSAKGRTELCSILKKNLDIFAWQPSDMIGVPIVTPFQKSTGKLNLSAATLSSVSWTLTKATTRYSWQNRMKRKQFSTLAKGCIATQNAFRPQEGWRHVPAAGGQSFRQPNWSKHRSAEYVIRDIHEGSCSMHVGPWSVVAKAIRLGYYWPTMHRDARDMILAMDYFTKWIEAKAVATITGSQSNGLVERANQSLGEGIKARLGEGNKNWVEELPHVLWAHRTMIKSSHGDKPLSLTYGTKAVIPAEIRMPTYRTVVVDVVYNDEELRLNLDLLEERRERVAIREAKAKLKMTKYYNVRVRGVTFRPGDFVYRRNDASHAVEGGKLGPKLEGPYEVTEALGDGAYKLQSTNKTVLPKWNIANLKRCYL
nr:hypothetical protein [Tanacetum cinerariifolium]